MTRERFSWITAQADGAEHAVTDSALAEARRGVFRGRCGTRFLAASMDAAPLHRCLNCRALISRRVA